MFRFLRRAAVLAAAAALTAAACTPALAAPTGGSGGPLTDSPTQQPFTASGITSEYQLFAAGLDWSKEVGLLLYTDGSGGYGIDNPNATYLLDADGQAGLVAVAKKHNMLLLVPEAPAPGCDGTDNCWYNASGTPSATAKADWARALVDHVYGRYNLERERVAIGGYSSGAQFTTRWFVPAHGAAVQSDGVFVAIAYGGAPAVTGTFPQSYKDAVVGVWNTGTADEAYTTASYGALGGEAWYRNNGFRTEGTWPAGVGHGRGGEFAGIMDRAITAHVRAPQPTGTTTPAPTPEPPAATAYATTVTPGENGVRFDIADVPAGAPATYVRVTKVSDGTQKFLYSAATGDISLTFATLGTAGDKYSYRVIPGSGTTTTPKASGTFRTSTPPPPAPVPGDRTGDGVVGLADLRDLSAARPDDAELADLVANWTR